jgi:endonuclease YncB( thermonuclease family)
VFSTHRGSDADARDMRNALSQTSCKGDHLNCFRPLLSLILVTAILFAFSPDLRAQEPVGTLHVLVVNVSDGDHLTVSNDGRELFVRLYGIDAPEIAKVRRNDTPQNRHGQPFAGRAFMELSNKVLHRQVTLQIKKIYQDEQVVAVVFLEGRNINLEMVAGGWAWAARTGKKRPDALEYQEAEQHARAERIGLWSQDAPLPPWEFRKLHKTHDLDNW